MELNELMQRRPAAKQGIRFDASGRLEVSAGEVMVPAKDIIRFHDASALVGRHLGLGASKGFALSDETAAVVVVATEHACIGVVENVPPRDELAVRELAIRSLVAPGASKVVGRHQGFLEVKR